MRILSVVGARPQFIKLAPLCRRLAGRHGHVVVHTGQHYDYEMSKAFFEALDIPEPDINLSVGSGSHGDQTGRMLVELDQVLAEERPDVVLVYGDTNSTLAGALAAIKVHIPVAHVEAGYRSFDISMPEEVNRIVADRVCQLHLAPTKDAVDNLVGEGIEPEGIALVGNIMAEALLASEDRVSRSTILDDLGLSEHAYAVLTMHRPENTERPERLVGICEGLSACPLPIIFAVHPRTQERMRSPELTRALGGADLRMVPPMRYLDFARLLAGARLALTDSGGVQEEAIIRGVPCLTLRYNTERVATVEAGANVLVGADGARIAAGITRWLDKPVRPGFEVPPMWDAEVSTRIVGALEERSARLVVAPDAALD